MNIVEVASHAGVSTATVSRVLNEIPGVRAETARQVRASLQALNYYPPRPNRAKKTDSLKGPNGRSPRARKRTNSIAILTIGQARNWLQLPVMGATVAGISRGAGDYGFQLVLDEVLDPVKPPDAVIDGVDGAIVFLAGVVDPLNPRDVFGPIRRHIPLVWVMGDGGAAANIDHVCPDNYEVGNLALKHLKDTGCRHVAYVCLNPDWKMMRSRGQGFAAAAREAHIRSTEYLLQAGPRGEMEDSQSFAFAKLEDLLDDLIKARPALDGIFIGNDAATVQIYPLLRERGIEPGEDINVVSCDNEEVRLSGLHPRPASIDVGAEEAGWRAVHRLASRLKNTQEPPVLIHVTPRLVLVENSALSGR